jgi:hypothetical protein
VNTPLQRLLGGVAVLNATGLLLLALVTHSAEYHTTFMRAFFRAGLPLLGIGILALIGYRFAALIIAAILFLIGGALVLSFLKVPFPLFLINWIFGALLMAPLGLIVREQIRQRKGM